MKKVAIILLPAIIICMRLSAQVPDSTFGMPESFAGIPGSYLPAVTGCDFDGRDDHAFTALHLDNGKIILVGHTRSSDGADLAFVRLLPNGHYDTGAGPNGNMRIDLGYLSDSCLTGALYGNDRIVAGGAARIAGQSGYVNLIARVDTNGQLDPGFGNGGHLTINLSSDNEMITGIIPLANGKILIAGNAYYGSFPDSTLVFVGCLMPDGQVDTSFGTDGFVFQRLEQGCNASLLSKIVVDSGGRIVISGASYHPYPGVLNDDPQCTHNIRIFRYLPNGVRDTTFAGTGMTVLPSTKGRATTLLIEDDDKIVVAGLIGGGLTFPLTTYMGRLMPDGSLDSTFANNGRFVQDLFGATDPAGSFDILSFNGYYYLGFLDIPDEVIHVSFGLIRVSHSGVWDTSFGTNGMFTTWAHLPFIGRIYQISTTDSLGIFFTGFYKKGAESNMMIYKVRLNNPISSTQEEAPARLKVFPNPASTGKLYFDFSGAATEEVIAIQLSDMQGRQVLQRRVSMISGINELDVSHLPGGMYVLQLTGRHYRGIEKVVIQ
ncbi:MAG: T9SS type A sorting domain-containing protein [Saprospiraceae bacterium]|nr:T9SS type A sorting domain-containing protein [Saprospiraceae bacterium]